MSGRYFNYKQYELMSIADSIRNLINQNDNTNKDEWGSDIGRHYSPETIAKFRLAVESIAAVSTMIHRIDYLLSGDDGEETFNVLWNETINKTKGN